MIRLWIIAILSVLLGVVAASKEKVEHHTCDFTITVTKEIGE